MSLYRHNALVQAEASNLLLDIYDAITQAKFLNKSIDFDYFLDKIEEQEFSQVYSNEYRKDILDKHPFAEDGTR